MIMTDQAPRRDFRHGEVVVVPHVYGTITRLKRSGIVLCQVGKIVKVRVRYGSRMKRDLAFMADELWRLNPEPKRGKPR